MENEELVLQIKAGENVTENMEQLYLQNRNFIYKVAKKYCACAEMEDLMQEAYFGLCMAVENFEPERGNKFITYLPYHLQRCFRRYIDNNRGMKRLPAYMVERISKYKKYLSERQTAGVIPSDYAICRDLGLSEQQLEILREVVREEECISTSGLLPGSETLTLEDTLADPSNMEEQVIDGMTREWANALIWKIVSELEEREAAVIIGRYRESATLNELKERLGVSQAYISDIEKKALAILKKRKEIREIADIYGYIDGYRGTGLQAFRDKGASSVEIAAIRHMEGQERIQRLKRSTEQTIDELFEQILNLASQGKGEQDE